MRESPEHSIYGTVLCTFSRQLVLKFMSLAIRQRRVNGDDSYTNTDIWDWMFAPFPPTKVKEKVKFTLGTGDEGPEGE